LQNGGRHDGKFEEANESEGIWLWSDQLGLFPSGEHGFYHEISMF
jgi:hypothetical protein